ncbi:methyltransferase TRM13-domain-containing protein [Obelidium mucronatum]|nr:methyltransferase TRM13-domain-containing protein [Obelidium mucronatum]
MSGQSQCTFFIAAKKRFCPLKVSKASASPFCPNHLPQLESNRIACSFCKAPILLSLLKKHTTKCNAKPPVSTPKYYCADVNRSIQSDPIPTPPHIRDLPLNELQTLIAKIRRAHEQIPKPHRILSEDAERSGEGKSKTQIQALIGRMADMNLLSSSLTFVEMGCGTAEFSHWVNEEIIKREKLENGVAHFILVDRDASRWKVKMDRGVFEKIRIDIKDLVLRKCASISRFDEKREVTVEGLVCISKHLCGAATDLALSCLKNYINSDPVVPLKSIVVVLPT